MYLRTDLTLFLIQLKVMQAGPSDIVTHAVASSDVSLSLHSTLTTFAEMTTGQEKWIPFYISFPPEKTVKMEASLMIPTEGGVARMHAMDLQFDNTDSTNPNVLCTSVTNDLRRMHLEYFEQTSNLTTFMQKDAVSLDMGYIINAGHSLKQGIHSDKDDMFAIKAKLQLADHVLNVHGALFDVQFAVSFNDATIVVTSQTIKVKRNTRTSELGDVLMEVNQTNVGQVYGVK